MITLIFHKIFRSFCPSKHIFPYSNNILLNLPPALSDISMVRIGISKAKQDSLRWLLLKLINTDSHDGRKSLVLWPSVLSKLFLENVDEKYMSSD